jgi:hypothetical protein
MKKENVAPRALVPYLIVAALAGCGGSPLSLGEQFVAPNAPQAVRGDAVKSWMASGAQARDLLYITTDGVDVYTYPKDRLVDQLSGFADPVGDCTEKRGNVYITDFTANTIVEYAHGGTRPIKALSVPGYHPFACAVDPHSGNLAVTDAGSYASGVGANVAIYPKATGTPKTYTEPEIAGYAYCTYDGSGNLFVDGAPARGYGYNYELAELPKGGGSLQTFNLQGGISWGAPLQWDGQYLAVGQPIKPYILRYTISGAYGILSGSMPLLDAYDARQFVIAGNNVIVTNQYYYDIYQVRWDVQVYKYPQGGHSTLEILNSRTGVNSVALSGRRK